MLVPLEICEAEVTVMESTGDDPRGLAEGKERELEGSDTGMKVCLVTAKFDGVFKNGGSEQRTRDWRWHWLKAATRWRWRLLAMEWSCTPAKNRPRSCGSGIP